VGKITRAYDQGVRAKNQIVDWNIGNCPMLGSGGIAAPHSPAGGTPPIFGSKSRDTPLGQRVHSIAGQTGQNLKKIAKFL